MESLSKSQVVKTVLLLLLLLYIPFVSSSLRPSYLYFVLNILIVALGVEAGFLKAISGPHTEKKAMTTITAPLNLSLNANNLPYDGANAIYKQQEVKADAEQPEKAKMPVEKVAMVATRMKKLKRCPSRPSIFFIGGSEGDTTGPKREEEKEKVEDDEEEKWKEAGELSKQELFAKAEAFIGNFYKQLKMQREESWKKIHGLYHRAF